MDDTCLPSAVCQDAEVQSISDTQAHRMLINLLPEPELCCTTSSIDEISNTEIIDRLLYYTKQLTKSLLCNWLGHQVEGSIQQQHAIATSYAELADCWMTKVIQEESAMLAAATAASVSGKGYHYLGLLFL